MLRPSATNQGGNMNAIAAQARITTAAHVLAQHRARQAVKRQLQAQGLKVTHYSARDISVLANQYLAEHRPELMPDAVETIERWTAEGVFGKRVARVFAKLHNSEH
jgi:hypothetical protein